MNSPDTIVTLENALYDYCCGTRTAKSVQKLFQSLGWRISLQQPDTGATMEAIDPDGNYVWLSC